MHNYHERVVHNMLYWVDFRVVHQMTPLEVWLQEARHIHCTINSMPNYNLQEVRTEAEIQLSLKRFPDSGISSLIWAGLC